VTAPLDGLLVADFSRVVAGPLVAATLGDLGAEVVKVERPGAGDDTRAWGPPWFDPGTGPEASYHLAPNRNKRSVLLDLHDPDDLLLARRLASRADVVVENFRVGTMARFGLDHDTIAATNPGVVTCSIEGFGDTPAAAELAGYDLLAQAMSGLMSITGAADGPPTKAGVALVDVLAALHAAVGVLAALTERQQTGRGRRVQVSLFDAALASLINQATAVVAAGEVPGRLGNRHPSIAPYTTLAAADRELALAVGNDEQFRRTCAVLGCPELADDARFVHNADRVAHVDELERRLAERLSTAPAAHWIEQLRAAGVPAGPVNDIAEAIELGRALGRDPVLVTERSDGTTVPTIRPPIRLTPAADERRAAPPRLGEHDAEVRAWLSTLPDPAPRP